MESPIFDHSAPLIDFGAHIPNECVRPPAQFCANSCNSAGSFIMPSLPIGASLGGSVGFATLTNGSMLDQPWAKLYGNAVMSDDEDEAEERSGHQTDFESLSSTTRGVEAWPTDSSSGVSTPQALAVSGKLPPPPPDSAVRARSPPQELLDALDRSGDIFLPSPYMALSLGDGPETLVAAT